MSISPILFAAGLPAAVSAGYLGILGCLSRRAPKTGDPLDVRSAPFFTFVVPAHDEAHGIGRTVRSLLDVDYPPERFSVVVVADNCTDDTADRAAQSGARVLIRTDESNRGKGFALRYAFETLIEEGKANAIVVVDADSDVSRNLLTAMASSLLAGQQVMQAHYGVRNVGDSWRTRLMDVAFTLYHGVRSSARERLALSCGLRGNGMGFAVSALKRVPYRAYSLVEDVEYGVELGLHGIRVAYLDGAAVYGEMVRDESGSRSQRKRWEHGRREMIARYVPKLLSYAWRRRSLMHLDLALDLLTPPLATVGVYAATGGCLSLACVVIGAASPVVLLPWSAAGLGLAAYLAAGIRLSPHGLRALADLSHAPKYALWKLALKVRGRDRKDQTWVRTRRNEEVP